MYEKILEFKYFVLKIKIQQFDCPSYHRDDLKSTFNFIIPLIIQIAFMFTLIINVGNIVYERQTKMKVFF